MNIDGVAGPETLRKLDTAPRAPSPSVPVKPPSKETPAAASGVSGRIQPLVQQDGTRCGLTSVAMIANAANAKAGTVEGNRVQYADPADGQMKWTTQETRGGSPVSTLPGRTQPRRGASWLLRASSCLRFSMASLRSRTAVSSVSNSRRTPLSLER